MLLRRTVVAALAALAFAGCAAAKDQISVSNVNGCIRHNCNDPNAQDYASCEATCRSTYGR